MVDNLVSKVVFGCGCDCCNQMVLPKDTVEYIFSCGFFCWLISETSCINILHYDINLSDLIGYV
jgi:hypothetical protein